MKSFLARCACSFLLIRCLYAAGPDYLLNEATPPDRASQLPTPYPPPTEELPKRGIFRSSDEPFFRDLEFSLQPRFYLRSLRSATGEDRTSAAGGALGLATGWWKDTVQLGLTGYTSLALDTTEDGIDRTGLVSPEGDSFGVLGQAWMKLRIQPATFTLFRQELELPFIHSDDSRLIPNTFEAYQVEVNPSETFRFSAGYVAKMKPRNRDNFISMSEAAGVPEVERGTAFAGFVLGAEDRTYLEAITQVTFDLFNTTYVQAGHTFRITEDFELRADLQFADQRSVGDELLGEFNTQFYGAQLAASYHSAVLSVAYNHTAKGAGIRDPFGADPSFTGLMLSNFVSAGEDAGLVGLSYNFAEAGLPGLTVFANYTYGVLPANRWQQEFNATVDYRIEEGPLENFWLRLRYARLEASGREPIDDFRVILNYAYTF
jgi:hypothetical protein